MRTIAAVLLVAGCTSHAPELAQPVQASSAESPWVRVRAATSMSLLEAPARVQVSSQSRGAVTPPLPARVMRVWVRPGQQVERGAPIVDVTMPQLVAAAGAYVSASTRVEAYARRKTQLEALRGEGLVKASEVADVGTRLAEAHADEQIALATLHSAGQSVSQAQHIAAGDGVVTLRSPVRGVVVELDAALGESRDASRAIARIVGEGDPRIEARLTHDPPAGATFELVIGSARHVVELVSRAPMVDARDGSRLAWFDPPKGTQLDDGATGRLRVVLPAALGAVAVPATAVRTTASGTVVYLHEGQRQTGVPVVVLALSGAEAIVTGAVHLGDEVAAEAPASPDGGRP